MAEFEDLVRDSRGQDAVSAPQPVGEFAVLVQQQRQQAAQTKQGTQAIETERRARIEALPELTGIAAGEDQAKLAALSPVLLSATDPREFGQILSSNFPNIGIQETPEGEILAFNNETGRRVVINKPGLSPADIIQGLGIAAAFTPAGRAATIGTQGLGQVTRQQVGRRAAQGAAASGVTEASLQAGQEVAGGEFDRGDVAVSAALGGVAETVLPAAQALREGRRAAQVGAEREGLSEVAGAILTGQEAVTGLREATGKQVGLFPAQQTLSPSQLIKQRILPQLSGSSRAAAKALERQNREVFDATTELVDTIAGDEAIATGTEVFRTAAQKGIEAAKTVRRERTSPLFEAAFNAAPAVDVKPVRDVIKSIADQFPDVGEVAKSLDKVTKLIDKKLDIEPSLRKLQGAKLEIDQMISKFGEGSLGNTTKAKILEVQNSLLQQMDAASPAFKEARDTFAAESPAVDKVKALLGRFANITDDQLDSLSNKVFAPGQTNPGLMLKTKQLIDDVNPDAWNGIVRVRLEDKFGSLNELVRTGSDDAIANMPAAIDRAIFGNPKQRAVFFRALDDDQTKNFSYLETVLKRAVKGRAQGSPTAAFGEAIKKIGGSFGVIRDTIFSPLRTVAGIGEQGIFDRNANKLAKAMFDPAWSAQMSQLRRLNPNSPAAARALTQLLNDVEKSEEQQ